MEYVPYLKDIIDNKHYFLYSYNTTIMPYKEYFKNSGKDYIVTCFNFLTVVANPCIMTKTNGVVFLSDMIKFWDEGYTYNGYPVVECKVRNLEDTTITYIKDGSLESVTTANPFDYDFLNYIRRETLTFQRLKHLCQYFK